MRLLDHPWKIALASLLIVGICLMAGWTVEPPSESAEQFAALRKRYAFQSLAKRLDYERRAIFDAKPQLSSEARHWLSLEDNPDSRTAYASGIRAQSLEMLHTLELKEFVEQSGFGVSRMPNVGVESVELKDVGPIAFDAAGTISSEKLNESSAPLPTAATAAASPDGTMTRWMPSYESVEILHVRLRDNFANPWSFGWIKNVNQVAGFEPHKISYPQLMPLDLARQPLVEQDGRQVPFDSPTKDSKYWKLTRLELVSLLKHETPRVYISDHLPRMEDLSSTNTRALAEFESQALIKLHEGEELQTAATPNRIEMLGAIRANNQCLKCHEVPHGTLLGAFSYELRRDPPISVKATTANVQ